MKRTDKLIFGIIFGCSFPIFFFLTAFMLWFCFSKDEQIVLYYVLGGVLSGALIDIICLKKLIKHAFDLPVVILIGLYIFYNICMFGFFMGFPVFNILMGIPVGYYFAKRIIHKNINPEHRALIIKKVSFFTAVIMVFICTFSGLIAITEKTIGAELQNMLRLAFEVSKEMVLAVIFMGGLTLIMGQYYLTRAVMIKTLKNNEQKNTQ